VSARRWLLMLVGLPTLFGSWAAIVLLVCCGAAHRLRLAPGLLLTGAWRSWADHGYSVTLGRAVVFTPRAYDATPVADNRVEQHELVHVRQAEDENAKSLLLALTVLVATGNHWLSLCIWCSGGLWLFVHNVAAATRYGVRFAYRDAEHERSAYAQTDPQRVPGTSWLELREEAKHK
jgi:hypothetical protein